MYNRSVKFNGRQADRQHYGISRSDGRVEKKGGTDRQTKGSFI